VAEPPVDPVIRCQRILVQMAQEHEQTAVSAEKRANEARSKIERASLKQIAFCAHEIADALRRAERRILTETGTTAPIPTAAQDDTVNIKGFIERSPTRLDLEPPPK
jgi:hypothetical protein